MSENLTVEVNGQRVPATRDKWADVWQRRSGKAVRTPYRVTYNGHQRRVYMSQDWDGRYLYLNCLYIVFGGKVLPLTKWQTEEVEAA